MVDHGLPWLNVPTARLCDEFERGQLGHAPLLHGPQGIGKHALAHALASAILCHNRGVSTVDTAPQATGGACGQCEACQMIAASSHPDLFVVSVLEDAKEIVVDQVRALIEKVALTPAAGAHRVAVIESAELMNVNAANALLKTLEEPPNNVWLILVSSAPGRLPPTVWSRCQKVVVQPPNLEDASRWLDLQAQAFDATQRRLALKMASGAPCLALSHLEGGLTETAESVWEALVGIAKGEGLRPDLPTQWADQASATWTCLAYWVSELATGEVLAFGDGGRLDEVLGQAHHNDWSELWSSALEGLALTGSGVRQDLLLGRWLLAWENHWHSG